MYDVSTTGYRKRSFCDVTCNIYIVCKAFNEKLITNHLTKSLTSTVHTTRNRTGNCGQGSELHRQATTLLNKNRTYLVMSGAWLCKQL